MEWYLGSEVDDLVVPRDQGSLAPDCWSQWGKTALGAGFDHSKRSLVVGTNSVCGQGVISFNGKNYSGAINMNNSGQEREDHADKSRAVCQGLYNGSIMWPYDEDQARIDRMEDIFLYKLNFCNSLLEDDATGEDNPNESIRYSSESDYGMIPADNMLNDMISEPQYIPSTSHGLGSFMYLEKYAFSQSMDWENAEDSSTCPGKSQQDNVNCHSGKEWSLEESVLQELERVTTQFTKKARINFRDALYRLAQSSKQPENLIQDGDMIMDDQPMLTSNDKTLRIRKVEVTELKTNAIDRAIASLMFSKMNFVNEDNDTVEQPNCGVTHLMFSKMNFVNEDDDTVEQLPNCGVRQHRISYCPQLARLAGDGEVPTSVGQIC